MTGSSPATDAFEEHRLPWPAPVPEAGPDPDPAAVARLRAWRMATSKDTLLPTYVVLPNSALYDLARPPWPRNQEELELRNSMGIVRTERYGADILAALWEGVEHYGNHEEVPAHE